MPKEGFQVAVREGNIASNYHLTSPDGKNWKKNEGRLTLRAVYMPKTDEEIDNLVLPLKKAVPTNRQILGQRAGRLRHKLYGVKYHIQNFIEQEETDIANFKKEHKGSDHDAIMNEPKLIYEVESFLFQVKSALDILAQIIGMVYHLSGVTRYSNGGRILVNQLRQNSAKAHRKEAERLAIIIESYAKWVDDLVDMRDEVTHFSDLEGFSCFIQHAWDGRPLANISYPSMPTGERARNYMQTSWNQLKDLIELTRPIIIEMMNTRSTSNRATAP